MKYIGTQYFSDNLKLPDITPVCQKKDLSQDGNYRPVSVLPCVSKIFERVFQKPFSGFIDNFLCPNLCGYRKGFNAQ